MNLISVTETRTLHATTYCYLSPCGKDWWWKQGQLGVHVKGKNKQ